MFVYPSRYEGFGLPVLEAMACGLPLIATTAGAVPEVAGSAAVLLAPDDARAWREAMRQVLIDTAFNARLRENARRQAMIFDWMSTATRTLACYEAVVRR
jgi:glycosyltransferase involved in cell wall biosynthesis